MAFFGVTVHGDYEQFANSQPVCHTLPFADIPDAAFEAEFDKHILGDCHEARALQVNGDEHIYRMKLIQILKDVLGREPEKVEFDTFFTWFDYDSNCVISRAEYRKACESLKESVRKNGEQREWFSYSTKHTDWVRHKRVGYEPQDTLVGDLKESHKIGWHAAKPRPPKDVHRAAGSTDVTQREGRSLMDYYGVYTLIGLQR